MIKPLLHTMHRKIGALNAALSHLQSLKSTPGLSLASAIVCDQKISEVLAWKAEIEKTPDFPLVHDMNKYMARATSAIAPKREASQIDASRADSVCPTAVDVPTPKRMKN
eukprot:COSAG02_NODE_13413_length_1398_cov_1.007698_2_plen_110_part_00